MIQIHGLSLENPNWNIVNILVILDTFKHYEVTDDSIYLRLLLFSLKDKVKIWLKSLALVTITWEVLAQMFLAKCL